MATVYEAHELQLDRATALKVLPPEFLHDTAFAKRFEREARLIASLEHQNIVPIYATGIDDGTPLHPWVGLLQRVLCVILFSCLIVLAVRLRRV